MLVAFSPALADCARTNPLLAAEGPGVAVVEVGFDAGGAPRDPRPLAGTLPALRPPGLGGEDAFFPTAGHRYLALVSADGHFLGCGAALDLGLPEEAAAAALLRAWVRAAPDRAALLAGHATTPGLTGEFALGALAARPDLLAALPGPAVASLVAATARVPDETADALSWIHARLGATAAVPGWLAWLERPHSGAGTRPVLEALRHLTNHSPEGYVPGHDVYGDDLARVRADFAGWWDRWKDRPAEGVAAGFAERPADDPLSAEVRRGRCELDARLPHTAQPAAGARGAVDPACP